MRKKLTKTGNSVALVLDRPLLEATGLEPGAEVEVSTDGDVIVITPRRDAARAEKLRSGMEEIHERFGGVFRRLEAGEDELTGLVVGVAAGKVRKAEVAVFLDEHPEPAGP